MIRAIALAVALAVGAAGPPDPRAAEATGDLRVLVIRATWGPAPAGSGDFSGTADFYRRASFGKLRLHIELTPWLQAYAAPVCITEQGVGDRARAAASAAGYDPAAYGRLVYVLPERVCPSGGLALGRDVLLAQDGGVLDDLALVHELGHTFGLQHPQGDPFSPMGHGGTDFSAVEKEKLGWISIQRVDRPGAYAVARIDEPSSQPQALVVATAAGDYWLERRADRLIARLVRAGSEFARSIYIGQAEDRFVARNVFSVTRDFAFRWLDKKRPSTPKVRALDHVWLSWARSRDTGSGVVGYRVTVDGKPVSVISDTGTALPPLRKGGHRVTVVAVDRAGNRSKPGVANLNV